MITDKNIIRLVKTDMQCPACGWKKTGLLDDTLNPFMFMCGRCLAVGLEVIKRYRYDKSNRTIAL